MLSVQSQHSDEILNSTPPKIRDPRSEQLARCKSHSHVEYIGLHSEEGAINASSKKQYQQILLEVDRKRHTFCAKIVFSVAVSFHNSASESEQVYSNNHTL